MIFYPPPLTKSTPPLRSNPGSATELQNYLGLVNKTLYLNRWEVYIIHINLFSLNVIEIVVTIFRELYKKGQ